MHYYFNLTLKKTMLETEKSFFGRFCTSNCLNEVFCKKYNDFLPNLEYQICKPTSWVYLIVSAEYSIEEIITWLIGNKKYTQHVTTNVIILNIGESKKIYWLKIYLMINALTFQPDGC